MRVLVTGTGPANALEWTHRVLLTAGTVALGYCGLALADSWFFQKRASLELDRAAPVTFDSEPPRFIEEGGLVGRIEMSRVGLSVMILNGTTPATLRRAVGHIPGTSVPGKGGNAAIAGHRDTFFRPLESVLIGDIFVVTVPGRQYRYQVVSIEIVSPLDTWVLAPTAEESLTLVTCHPFDFIGSAPSRFIVRARRIPGSSALPSGGQGATKHFRSFGLPRSSEVEVGQRAARLRFSVSAPHPRAKQSRMPPRP